MYTKRIHNTIVAFFARGREIGFVLMDSGQILRYGVKTVKGKKLESNLIQRVENVLATAITSIGTHGAIVVERNNPRSSKGVLCQALHSLSKRLKRQGYQVLLVSWKEAQQRLCEDEKGTQREIIQAMVERQPLLWSLFSRSTDQRATYWKKVLLAGALVEVAWQKLEREKGGSVHCC
ncbi:MAG: hypothetical protein HYZ51_03350 [Candidatus Doudnabacteria bacterium]|nr:hypothetical protein [Candidatus Doudnabacteria bacterium]